MGLAVLKGGASRTRPAGTPVQGSPLSEMAPGPAALAPRAAARSASHGNLPAAFSPVFDLELLELDGGRPGDADGLGFGHTRWSQLTLGPAGGGVTVSAVAARLHAVMRDGSLFTSQLWQDLHRLRAIHTEAPRASPEPSPAPGAAACAFASRPGSSSSCHSGAAAPSGAASAASGELPRACPADNTNAAANASGPVAGIVTTGGGSVDVDAIARDLLAAGYLVQLRDEAPAERPKDARSCLQQLRHRFIACVGARGGACSGGGGGHVADAVGDAHYLSEPLIVEPRFREQFVIAAPTPAYEALLEAVPSCFVGTAARLEAAVALLTEAMAAAFREQGLPVPPWRSKAATLSKWAPQQLAALAAKIAGLRRLSMPGGGGGGGGGVGDGLHAPAHAHAQLASGERPAAVAVAHAAAGSAPAGAGDGGGGACGAAGGLAPYQGSLPFYHYPAAAAPPACVPMSVDCRGPPTEAACPIAPPPPPAAAPPPPPPPPPPRVPSGGALSQVAHAVATALGGGGGLAPSGSLLKFTRKASAEWKKAGEKAGGKKVKSLLAAALKKSGSRGNLNAAAAAAPAAAAAAAAAAGDRGGGGAPGGSGGGGPVIRTVANEPGCGRITTVRWGALHEQRR